GALVTADGVRQRRGRAVVQVGWVQYDVAQAGRAEAVAVGGIVGDLHQAEVLAIPFAQIVEGRARVLGVGVGEQRARVARGAAAFGERLLPAQGGLIQLALPAPVAVVGRIKRDQLALERGD